MPHDSIRFSKESLAQARPKDRVPHLFGRGGRDRVLICLAINGPMHVRHIARTIGSDSHKVWNMIESLRAINVVVKREQDGGRKYAALNRELPIYRPLHRLLIAMDKHWPIPRIDRPITRWRMPHNGSMHPRLPDDLFQGAARSRVLLLVAAADAADADTLCSLSGLSRGKVVHAVYRWRREGVIQAVRARRRTSYALDPNFEAAPQLKSLLLKIVKHSPDLRALRKAARHGKPSRDVPNRAVYSA